LKKRIKVSTGDLKHVVDLLELMMKKQISEHQYKLNALKLRQVRAHQIMIFEWAVEFVNPEALDIVLEHWQKLKKGEISRVCDGTFEKTIGLLCAYTCERQQARGKPLLLSKFNKRWRYKQREELGEGTDMPYELTRNPAVIPRKRGKGKQAQAISSTRRDASHWEQQGRGRGSGRAGQAGRQAGGRAGGRAGVQAGGRASGRAVKAGRAGRGIGRQAGRGKEKEAAPIEVSSDDGVLSEISIATEDEIWVERAREKRRRQPTVKAAEAAKAKAEAEKAAMEKAAAAAAAQAEIDFWEL
jgi:hypothetical protein